MKTVILENDSELSDRLLTYLYENKILYEFIGMADRRQSEEIAELFSEHEILIVEPTMLTFSQYNLMLMLMYDLLTKNKLKIKEVQFFDDVEDITDGLRELWEDKRMYLDQVLKHVELFAIDKMSHEKIKLEI